MIDRDKLAADIYVQLLGLHGKTEEWRRQDSIRQADELIDALKASQPDKPKPRRRESVTA